MAKSNLNIMNYVALGLGEIGTGVAIKAIPIGNNYVKAGIAIVGGFMLTRTKNELAQYAGLGVMGRGMNALASSFGLGEDEIATELAGNLDESEMSEELAEELEAALAEDTGSVMQRY